MRLGNGRDVLAFNGRDGEWRCRYEGRKSSGLLVPLDRLRAQSAVADLHLCFAPLKHARLDYLVQKAVEMGAGRLQPVMTSRTQASRVNEERMRANAIEARRAMRQSSAFPRSGPRFASTLSWPIGTRTA